MLVFFIPCPYRPWSYLGSTYQGNTTILVIISRFSKACCLIPLHKLPSSPGLKSQPIFPPWTTGYTGAIRSGMLPTYICNELSFNKRSRRIGANDPFLCFAPRQRVWLPIHDLQVLYKKLSPRYVGPFKIISQINPVTYKLLLPSNYSSLPYNPVFAFAY